MGTRHLTAVILNDEYKVAQYGQWDGHLSGQGETIFEFLHKVYYGYYDYDQFKKNISKCTFITQKDIDKKYEELGVCLNDGFITCDDSDKFKSEYPALNRDIGADILKFIYRDENVKIINKKETIELSSSLNFAADSLFCEFAYVVNLDTEELEIYTGFNREKELTEDDRFYFLQDQIPERTEKYYPIVLFKTVKFKDITEKLLQELDEKLNEEDEDE